MFNDKTDAISITLEHICAMRHVRATWTHIAIYKQETDEHLLYV